MLENYSKAKKPLFQHKPSSRIYFENNLKQPILLLVNDLKF